MASVSSPCINTARCFFPIRFVHRRASFDLAPNTRSNPSILISLLSLKLTDMAKQRQHQYNNPGYLPNGANQGHPNLPPGAAPLLPNNGRVIQTGGVRVLCVADVRGEEIG